MFVSQIYEECAEILGTTNSGKVFRKISQAVQTLMESGHWSHSTAEIDICTGWDGQSVTLPRGVDVPLAVNVDGSPVYFRNRLFQYHVNKGGMFNPVGWAWDDRGYTPTMMEIRQPSQLIAIAETDNDVGKQIRVIGINGNNVPLRSQLENGTGVDGLLVPIHSQKDFPFGTIIPDDQTIETRLVSIDPITKFENNNGNPHQLTSGQGINISSQSGVIPPPLYNGKVSYVGVIDALTIQLFNDQNNAKNGNFPIEMESIVGSGTIKITDSKPSEVVTAIRMNSAVPVAVTTGNPVVFPDVGVILPTPLKKKVTYFANLISDTDLNIFESFEDAQNNINPVYCNNSSLPFKVDVRKEIFPETKLTFSIQHYYKQGDQIQVYTAGGVLPTPLISNQNYFVNIVDPFTITIHETQADANSSTPTNFINPIKIIDSGNGTNYVVKLISSTFRSGETSQITAAGLNIASPTGSGANFQAVVTGSVRAVQVTAQGNGYTTVPGVTFSEPPDPPIGSGQQAETATGYAIINTISTKLEQIIITNPGFGYTSPPAITIDPPSGASPAQATASATIQTSFVSYFRKISGGNNYTQPPQVQITGGGGSGATAQAIVNNSILNLNSISVVGTTATATTSSPHGFSAGSIVTIQNASPAIPFNGDKAVLSVPLLNTAINSIVRVGTTATVTTATNHNYSTGQIVTIAGTTEPQYLGSYAITVINSTQFTYTVTGNPATPAGGASKTASIPSPAGTTFTFTVPSGTTNAIPNTGTVFSGEVVALNIITSGTGYTSAPNIVLTPSTGVFIEFASTGTLPSPLVAGTAYRAEAPLDTNSGVFTVRNADFSKINITGGGSGTFYTVLSRSFGVDFTDRWLGDFSNITTGQGIYFGSDFILPTTSPAIDNSTEFFLDVISPSVARIRNGAMTYLQVISFGTGQSYFGIRRTANVAIPENTIKPDSVLYLKDDQIVKFTSSNALPSPLVAGTDYKIKLFGDAVKVYTTSGSLIALLNPGAGKLTMDIERIVKPLPSTSIICEKAIYENGQSIKVRPADGDILPTGLVAGTSYYVRRVSENIIELYDTAAHAKGTGTIGRKEFTTPGNSIESQFYIDAIDDEVLVKTIHQIEKPLTDGFVSLYAWDFGRSNDMTLIGQYHPSEINPQYRRIRIGQCCAWVRLAYRMSPPFITSMYDYIPIEHERAIIAAIHAVDMEDKDFADQSARYWGIAFNYLRNQQEYIDGHAMVPPQINNVTYGDGTDCVIN